MNKLVLSITIWCTFFIQSTAIINAAETVKALKSPILRRGVEVDLVIKGMITSRQHPTRKTMRIYVMMKSHISSLTSYSKSMMQ